MRNCQEINRRVGAAVRDRRVRLGLTQVAIAKSLGVAHQLIQQYEAGTTQLTLARVFDLAVVLGTSPCDLVAAAGGAPRDDRGDLSDRATLELVKRLVMLKPHERAAVTLLIRKLAEGA